MKIIENKKTSLPKIIEDKAGNPIPSTKEKADYFELIKICVNKINPVEGITIQQMNKKLRVTKALEKAKDNKAEIEDADFETIKSCVVNFKWGMVHKDIVEFHNYINQINEDNN